TKCIQKHVRSHHECERNPHPALLATCPKEQQRRRDRSKSESLWQESEAKGKHHEQVSQHEHLVNLETRLWRLNLLASSFLRALVPAFCPTRGANALADTDQ